MAPAYKCDLLPIPIYYRLHPPKIVEFHIEDTERLERQIQRKCPYGSELLWWPVACWSIIREIMYFYYSMILLWYWRRIHYVKPLNFFLVGMIKLTSFLTGRYVELYLFRQQINDQRRTRLGEDCSYARNGVLLFIYTIPEIFKTWRYSYVVLCSFLHALLQQMPTTRTC